MGLYGLLLPFLGAVLAANLHERVDSSVLPYKDASLTPTERADDLLSRMNWEEKIGQMGGFRRFANANLTFNRTNYEIFTKDQNGILGKKFVYLLWLHLTIDQVLATVTMHRSTYSRSSTKLDWSKSTQPDLGYRGSPSLTLSTLFISSTGLFSPPPFLWAPPSTFPSTRRS